MRGEPGGARDDPGRARSEPAAGRGKPDAGRAEERRGRTAGMREAPGGAAAGAAEKTGDCPGGSACGADGCARSEDGCEPAPGPGAGGTSSGSLRGDWDRLLGELRRGRAFLASCLHESAALTLADGRLLVSLDDPNGFKREQLEKPTNRRYILRMIEEIFGQPLGIRLIDAAEVAALAAAARGGAADAPRGVVAPSAGEARPQPGEAAPPAKGTAGRGRASGADRVREIADLMNGDIVGPAR